MIFLGEIIALFASLFWTVSAMSAEYSSKKIGAVAVNLWAMIFAFIFLNILLLCVTGSPIPQHLSFSAFVWIVMSGILAYVVCNYFLFNAYILIGSRFSELFMTLSAPAAAFGGWILLDERLTSQEYVGITITITGILVTLLGAKTSKNKIINHLSKSNTTSASISVHENQDSGNNSDDKKRMVKGIVYAIIGTISQGFGLVLGKVGMIHYHLSMPSDLKLLNDMIPLSASYIRLMTGLLGFFLIIVLSGKFSDFRKSIHKTKAFRMALLTAFCGPFLGASCALVAMRYSKAGVAATLLELTPIFIIFPAYFILKQKINFIQILGTVISVLGVSLFFIKL